MSQPDPQISLYKRQLLGEGGKKESDLLNLLNAVANQNKPYRMKNSFDCELALKKGGSALRTVLKLLTNPDSSQSYRNHSSQAFACTARYIQQFSHIQKLKGVLKFIMSVILVGHVHILESFNRTLWPTIIDLHKGLMAQNESKLIMDEQTYLWNRRWAFQLICLMAEWLPSDFYEENRDSLYRLTEKKLQLSKKVHKILTLQTVEKVEQEIQKMKLEDSKVCPLCQTCKQNKQNIRNRKKNLLSRLKNPSITPISPPSSSKNLSSMRDLYSQSLKQAAENYGVGNIVTQTKKVSFSSRSLEIKSKMRERKERKSQKESAKRYIKSASGQKKPNLLPPAINIYSTLPIHSHPDLSRYLAKNPQEQAARSANLSNPISKSVASNTGGSKSKMSTQVSSSHQSVYAKYLDTMTTEASFNFKEQLKSRNDGRVQLENGISVSVRNVKGILSLDYNNPQIQSFEVLEPLELKIKENRKRRVILFDFSKGPSLMRVRINDQPSDQIVPLGYLRVMESANDLQEWEIDKSYLRKKMYFGKTKVSKILEEISQNLGLIGLKAKTSLLTKYEGAFIIGSHIIKLSLQSVGSNKIMLQGWSDRRPTSINIVEEVLAQIMLCLP